MIGRNRIPVLGEAATLQYAGGRSMARSADGVARFAPWAGFHIEVGRDAQLDQCLGRAQLPQIEIKHQRPGGIEVVRHWALGEAIAIYPVTSGPVAGTVGGSLGRRATATAEAGIGVRWGANERSKCAVRVFIEPCVRAGYLRTLTFSVRSRMSDTLLAALVDHGRICEAADALIDRTRHPEPVAYHELALPLGPAPEEEWGRGETTTVVPFHSMHPTTVDVEYLRSHWRSDAIDAAALQEWPGIQRWAHEYAAERDERDAAVTAA